MVEAFDLEPQTAIAGCVRSIGALRDDPFDPEGTGFFVKGRAEPDLVIAVLQGRFHPRQQAGEPFLAIDQRPCGKILAVEVEKIEQKEYQPAALPASDAIWIMLNEVIPLARTPHSSPSR
jgi:hypothetical protein